MNINDIVNEGKTSFTSMTLKETNNKFATSPEKRSDSKNEYLAAEIKQKLNAQGKREPYLAVAYSGIPWSVVERHATTANEVGRNPPALFFHLIKQEPLWRAYKQRKGDEIEADGE